jgi:hypothetical protein
MGPFTYVTISNISTAQRLAAMRRVYLSAVFPSASSMEKDNPLTLHLACRRRELLAPKVGLGRKRAQTCGDQFKWRADVTAG